MANSSWLLIIGRLGDPIFAGLRRAFTEPVAQPVDAALPEDTTAPPSEPDQVARRLGDIGIKIVAAGRAGAGWAVRMAAERSIAPNSVTGISLLIGLCAAAWLSGGSRADAVRGLIATGVWVLSRVGARQLAAVVAQLNLSARDGRGKAGSRQPDRSDWLILPAFDWTTADWTTADWTAADRTTAGEQPAAGPAATAGSAGEVAAARRFGWLYAVCATAAECAIYGGIAAGAQAAGYPASWPLAFVVVVAGSVVAIARAIDPTPTVARRLRGFPPAGLKTLLAVLILVGYGPRIALFTVIVIDVVILARALTGTARRRSAVRLEKLRACRDDGPLARRAGALVRGNLTPMPAAVAGLIAIGTLTALGLANLPGIVALTPVVALLLAAPGSSHPHDGRVDWLVPVLLCLGQYGCLGALGAARSVPWLVIFASGCLTAVWYTGLAASQAGGAERARGIGWDGRICLVGLAGMVGIATFGYLGLTAFLGAQICGKAMRDYLRQGEDRRR